MRRERTDANDGIDDAIKGRRPMDYVPHPSSCAQSSELRWPSCSISTTASPSSKAASSPVNEKGLCKLGRR